MTLEAYPIVVKDRAQPSKIPINNFFTYQIFALSLYRYVKGLADVSIGESFLCHYWFPSRVSIQLLKSALKSSQPVIDRIGHLIVSRVSRVNPVRLTINRRVIS